jgi:hypothetical protein
MTAADGTGFGYGNNGLLLGRTNSSLAYAVNQRDGEGRMLQATTSAGVQTLLTENLSWLNNGQLSAYSAARGDFTDSRNYGYSALARRVTQESFNVAASQKLTNNYAVDQGQGGALGVLTAQTVSGASSASWAAPASGGLDGLSRVAQAQDSVISRSAYGTAQGAGTVSATLDGHPLSAQFRQWTSGRSQVFPIHKMELASRRKQAEYLRHEPGETAMGRLRRSAKKETSNRQDQILDRFARPGGWPGGNRRLGAERTAAQRQPGPTAHGHGQRWRDQIRHRGKQGIGRAGAQGRVRCGRQRG